MGLNFKEALATLSKALPLVLFRAGIFVAGGFTVIILFGMLLFIFRPAGGASQAVAILTTVLALLGWSIIGLFLQRFFLFRQRATLLLLFSGFPLPALGLSRAIKETRRFFPNHSRWAVVNRGLRRALSVFYRGSREFPVLPAAPASGRFSGILDLLALGPISQAIVALAFSRSGTDAGQAAREGLSLYFSYGKESRRLARRWLRFSIVGLIFLFLCLALPNWFFFSSAGAPVWIGIALAAVIAWILYQAFVVPFALAGVSATLLAETSGKTPDPGLYEKMDSMIPDTTLPGKRMD